VIRYFRFLLPLFGICLGYGLAYLEYHGLLLAWQPVGNPGQHIQQILGTQDARRLLVVTQSDKVSALEFVEQQPRSLLLPANWQPAQSSDLDPHRELVYNGEDFYSRPPPIVPKQVYTHGYIYRVEGKGELGFALDEDGNLWVWDHKISGLSGLIFFYYPLLGLLAGLALILLIMGIGWLKQRSPNSRSDLPRQA